MTLAFVRASLGDETVLQVAHDASCLGEGVLEAPVGRRVQRRVARAVLARVLLLDGQRAELERVASASCLQCELVGISRPCHLNIRAVVAHLLEDQVVAVGRAARADPQHGQILGREDRTIGIDLGAVGGVLPLLLVDCECLVSEPNITERLLRQAHNLSSGVAVSGTRH